MKRALFFLTVFSGVFFAAEAQNIAISDDSSHVADNSAILDIHSDSKGMLIPRLTFSQRQSVASPANGLLIYQTDEKEGFYVNQGTPANPEWVGISSESNSLWSRDSSETRTLLSNPGDLVGIGTTDPGAKLSANGTIRSLSGGFKFPDGTVQTTASGNASEETAAAEGRWLVLMYCGECPGEGGPQGYEDFSPVYDLEWGIHVPRDVNTGQVSGARKHQCLTITKNIDRATVCYIQKCTEGYQLNNFVELLFFWFDPAGNEELYYRIILDDPVVVDFYHDVSYTGNGQFAHMDVISFIYPQITWENIKHGIMHSDTWIPGP